MAVSKKAIEDAHVNRRKTFKEYNTANAVVNPSAQEIAHSSKSFSETGLESSTESVS